MNKLVVILFIAVITSCNSQGNEGKEIMKQAETVTLPRILGEEQGRIIKWHVEVGDKIQQGSILADLEMGDATFELESYASGTVLYIGAKTNQEVNV